VLREWVGRVLCLIPSGGIVLDAPSGTGKYFPMVAAAGHRVAGVDAMENIPPEDRPLVLANLHRAVRPGGVLYLTVEKVEQTEIDQAFQDLSARGLPAVRGEILEGDVAGYHYYPGRDQAVEWFGRERLAIVDEGFRGDVDPTVTDKYGIGWQVNIGSAGA
jgi:hypothetical protein